MALHIAVVNTRTISTSIKIQYNVLNNRGRHSCGDTDTRVDVNIGYLCHVRQITCT